MSVRTRVLCIAALIVAFGGGILATVTFAGCSCPTRPTRGVPGEDHAAEYHLAALEQPAQDALVARAERENRPVTFLALSGGAQNGAFGAGILCNWVDRPAHVDVWTGISTGALLLTHGFLLGPEHSFGTADDNAVRERYRKELEEAYTTYSEDDLMDKRSLLCVVSKSGLADMSGLRRVVDRYLPNETIDLVKKLALDTDVLTVGTTDMDSGRFVDWDLKKLAQHGMYDLYRKIVFASCLEPAAMDPEYIAGHMHVDGGVRYQIYAPKMEEEIRSLGATRAIRFRAVHGETPPTEPIRAAPGEKPLVAIYLLVNGRLEFLESSQPEPPLIGTCFFDVAMRAVDILAMESRLGNLLRIQTAIDDLAREKLQDPDSQLFQRALAAMEPDFQGVPQSHFDRDFMRDLFTYGAQRARARLAWRPWRMAGRQIEFK